jgi:hypothetical protein
VQDLTGFVIVEPVAIVVLGKHLVQEVGVVVLVRVARSDRRGVILNNFLVIVLQQLVPTLYN